MHRLRNKARARSPKPKITWDTTHDVSPPLRVLAANRVAPDAEDPADEPDLGPRAGADTGYSGDGALQSALLPAAIPSTQQNFEGLSNEDNFNIFGGRVNPPDPVGEVGPNNYVEMVNLTFAVYDKAGNKLLGPVDTGTLWSGFAVPDCTDPSGDPVVLYDQITDRWILSQFTTSGLDDPSKPFWNCVAVSTTSDPTGSYYRYAFETAHFQFFPDYPKYGNWTDAYVLTTREFGPTVEYGIGVYALEKNKMVNGQSGTCSELLPRRERPRHSPARRRRAPARGHRREAEAEDRHGDPDRRDTRRQRDRLRRHVRRR